MGIWKRIFGEAPASTHQGKASKPPPFGEASNAIQYFDKALELDRDNHLAWHYKGSSLAMIGQFTRDASKVKQGLECLNQALRTQPGDEATKQAIRDFRNLYATLQDHSSRRQEAEGTCDVCTFPINFADGYALTTQQVVPTVAYWEVALKGQLNALLGDDPEAAAALCTLVARQASQSTGWLVCEVCADLFQFDRASAKEYACKRMNPPDAGPLPDHEDTLVAALAARLMLKEKSV